MTILYEATVDFDDRLVIVTGTHDESGSTVRFAGNLDTLNLTDIRGLTSTLEQAIRNGIIGLGEELGYGIA
jgi:hypothetical protein